jgi:hypothetical protein
MLKSLFLLFRKSIKTKTQLILENIFIAKHFEIILFNTQNQPFIIAKTVLFSFEFYIFRPI